MVKSDGHCAICFEHMKDVDATHLSCLHGFHKTCIAEWLNVNNSCPMCRTVVALDDEQIIYVPPVAMISHTQPVAMIPHSSRTYTRSICGTLIVVLYIAFNYLMLTYMFWVGEGRDLYFSVIVTIFVNCCTLGAAHRWFTECGLR